MIEAVFYAECPTLRCRLLNVLIYQMESLVPNDTIRHAVSLHPYCFGSQGYMVIWCCALFGALLMAGCEELIKVCKTI